MDRRHFQLIADVIAAYTFEGSEPEAERAMFAAAMADKLAETNPRFNRARFLIACGAEQ